MKIGFSGYTLGGTYWSKWLKGGFIVSLRVAKFIECKVCKEHFYVYVVNPDSQIPLCGKCFFNMRMFIIFINILGFIWRIL